MRVLLHYLLMFVIAVLPLQGGAIAAMPAGMGLAVEQHGHAATQAVKHASGPTADAECCGEGSTVVKSGDAHAKCNASANCCVGAVAPPTALAGISSQLSPTSVWSSREPAMTAVVPPTIERPPRLAC